MRFGLAALVFLISTGVAEAKLYGNARFGFFIDIPALFPVVGPEPENGDGLTFSTKDGSAEVSASGGWITHDGFALEVEMFKGVAKDEGWKLTYESKIGASSAAYSGVKGGRVFYERLIASCRGHARAGFRLEYPAAEKTRYDAAVKHLSATLKPGKGSCG